MECIHSVLICHTIYTSTVTFYGQPEHLRYIPKSMSGAVIISAFIGPVVQVVTILSFSVHPLTHVQSFFAYRIYKLSRRLPIPFLCYTLSFIRLLSLLGVALTALKTPLISEFKEKWDWVLLASLALSTFLDIFIASTLCFYLWRYRDRGFEQYAFSHFVSVQGLNSTQYQEDGRSDDCMGHS